MEEPYARVLWILHREEPKKFLAASSGKLTNSQPLPKASCQETLGKDWEVKWERAVKGFHPHFMLTSHRLMGTAASTQKNRRILGTGKKACQAIRISRDAEEILTHSLKGDMKSQICMKCT